MRYFTFLPLVFLAALAQAQITSNFDTDAEGWKLINDGDDDTLAIVHNSSGGNPGSYISAAVPTDTYPSFFWYAPSKFLGNLTYSSLGLTLTYSQQQLVTGDNGEFNGNYYEIYSPDIIITSGNTSIYYHTSPKPTLTPDWTTYTVTLDETSAWRTGAYTSSPLATREQIKTALTNVTSLMIRGNYNLTANTIGLDEVTLGKHPVVIAPSVSSFAPTTGNPGSSITISGSDFDPTPSNNAVYFGAQAGTITSASSSSLTVTIPPGATYGNLTVINKTTGLAKSSSQPFVPTFADGGRIIPASFNPKFDILTSVQTGGLAMADVDGDGWNDLVVARVGNAGIDVYQNLGLGGDLTTSSFATPVLFSSGGAGTNGTGLRLVDLDGDGKLDMVTSIGRSAFVGSFATFRNISTPGNLAFEAVEYWDGKSDESPVYNVADIDGDGLPELIGGEGSGGAGQNVWITQNISSPGNIEFGYSLFYFSDTLDDAASGATIADLDNDGKPEFILKRGFGGAFTVFTNTSTPGAISFGTNFSITQGISGDINVADFNQDGKNDLAWKQGFSNDDVHIRINTNSGGPLAAADFATEVILNSELNNYGGISLTDVNGDGKVDIMANDGADFAVFENVFAGGAFSASSFVSAYKRPGSSFYPTTIVAGDLNGDTKPDLVFSSTNAPSQLSIIENKNVHTPVISLTTVSPLAGAIGSTVTITGDFFSTTLTDNHVYFGTIEATVLTATKTQLTVTVPAGAQYAPVSVTRDRLTSTYHLPFNVTFSTGTTFDGSSFAAPVNFTLTSAYYEVVTGDLNSDGKPDVVATGGTFDAYAFRNTHSSGSISASSLIADDTLDSFGFNHLPSLQDFDGDGKTDVIVHEGYFYQNLSTLSEIDFINGPSFEFYSLNHSFGDFDHDGKTDFVGTRFSESKIIVTTNKTTPGPFVFFNGVQADFASFDIGVSAISFTKPAAFGYTAVADFDNDGWADIVATNSATDNFTVWKNNQTNRISTSSFTNIGDIATGDNPGRIYAGDLDVDGKVDLMMYYGTGTSSGIISIFHNTSTGSISFSRQDFTIGAGSNGGASAIGDLDGDGKPEIVVPSETANVFRIFKNNTSPGVINGSSFTASPTFTVTTPRAAAIGDINLDGKLEIIITSAPNSLLVFENLIPAASISFTTQPANAIICEGNNSTFVVSATGDTNLQYQWQINNAGFVDLANGSTYSGVTSSTLTITNPSISLNGSIYRCVVRGDNSTDTPSSSTTLIINPTPIIIALADVNLACAPAGTTLTPSGASTNEEYKFYDAATGGNLLGNGLSFTTPSLTVSTTYHISTFNTVTTCESGRISTTVLVQTCNPPEVTPTTTAAFLEGIVTVDLESLISDPDDNEDLTTLQITVQPSSGAPASLDGLILTIDYTGIPFPGTDQLSIEVCDLTSICTEQQLTIELSGDIEVFNAISPNNDGTNDKFILQYIELFPDTEKNKVTIYNRWGDIVFEISNYNNTDRVFIGQSDNGKDLPSGTYFYKIEFTSGRETKTGYLSLKR